MLCPVSVLYRFDRTMMIARETCQTFTIVIPLRYFLFLIVNKRYVINRADLLTCSAANTLVTVNMEWLICNKVLDKETANGS